MYKKLIITHQNCVDGCCAKAILRSVFKESANYLEVDHADYNPNFPEKYEKFLNNIEGYKNTEIIMSDICLPVEWINKFLADNNKVTIIDHHNSQLPVINELEKRKESNPELDITIVFSKDNSESGAMLTWKYIYPNQSLPKVVEYISEGDIWKFKHPETKYFYSGLLDTKDAKDYSDKEWDKIITDTKLVQSIVDKGKPIREAFLKEAHSYAPDARKITINGREGLFVVAPSKYTSELGNLLAQQCKEFALIVEEREDCVSCSLRSVAPITVDDIARKFGGGGHQQASGFKLKNLQELENLLKNEGNDISFTQSRKMKI